MRIVGMGQREDGELGPGISVEQFVEPLRRNQARAGDYSFESIRGLGNAVPMRVENSGDRLLELFVEPTRQEVPGAHQRPDGVY